MALRVTQLTHQKLFYMTVCFGSLTREQYCSICLYGWQNFGFPRCLDNCPQNSHLDSQVIKGCRRCSPKPLGCYSKRSRLRNTEKYIHVQLRWDSRFHKSEDKSSCHEHPMPQINRLFLKASQGIWLLLMQMRASPFWFQEIRLQLEGTKRQISTEPLFSWVFAYFRMMSSFSVGVNT